MADWGPCRAFDGANRQAGDQVACQGIENSPTSSCFAAGPVPVSSQSSARAGSASFRLLKGNLRVFSEYAPRQLAASKDSKEAERLTNQR